MANKLSEQQNSLQKILCDNRLLSKSAQDQKITHPDLVGGQKGIGSEQTAAINSDAKGVLASTPAASNDSKVQDAQAPDSSAFLHNLNDSPNKELTVKTMTSNGDKSGDIQSCAKTAQLYQTKLASLISGLRKQQTAAAPTEIVTASEVMDKFASLNQKSSEQDFAQAKDLFEKMAATNPVFNQTRDAILMHKYAEDIQQLAQAEGIPEDQAQAQLDQAIAQDPEAQAAAAEAEDAAAGEQLVDTAEAEADTDALIGSIQEMADNASQVTGQQITPDDIIASAEQTIELADQLGVEPEQLVQAAVEEMVSGGAGGGSDVTEEDMQNAQAILDDAAANGISPEEVIQMAADELQNGSDEPAPAQKTPAEGETKEASYQPGTGVAARAQKLLRGL